MTPKALTLDDLKPGEVYVTPGASPRYALWGGLMSTRAQSLGAHGAVMDGFHRDTREIRKLGFPVFSRGAYAQDQRLRGRVIDFRCTVEFRNGVRVAPGDVIVCDIDGVLVIPREHVHASHNGAKCRRQPRHADRAEAAGGRRGTRF